MRCSYPGQTVAANESGPCMSLLRHFCSRSIRSSVWPVPSHSLSARSTRCCLPSSCTEYSLRHRRTLDPSFGMTLANHIFQEIYGSTHFHMTLFCRIRRVTGLAHIGTAVTFGEACFSGEQAKKDVVTVTRSRLPCDYDALAEKMTLRICSISLVLRKAPSEQANLIWHD